MSESTPSGAADPFQGGPDDVIALIGEFPLAWVTTRDDRAAQVATLLPMLARTDAEGRVVSLLGHMARRNPLYAALQEQPKAALLFTGPQGYVSPALISNKTWAPTWNYAQIRIEADIRLRPDLGHEALDQLTRYMDRQDQSGWQPRDVGPRYDAMERAIIAFEADVTSLTSKFKLAQDETDQSLDEILSGHRDPVLVNWMRRMNAHRL